MAYSCNSRDHHRIVRRPAVVLVSAMAALFLGGVPAAPAATVRATMPGFTAEHVGSFPNACGAGPTSLAVVGGTLFMAADTGLYYTKQGGLTAYTGENQARPWGLTVLNGTLFGTTPRCGTEPATDPVEGTNCRVVSIGTGNGRGTEVADVCGYGIAADPRTSTLTVARRDGMVVSVNPDRSAPSELFSAPSARTLAWSEDGARLYIGFENGTVSVWERSGSPRRMAGVSGVRGLAAGTSAVNLAGSALLGVNGAVRAAPGDEVASTGGEQASALVAAPDGVYAAFRGDLWRLRGRYSPPGPPPPPRQGPPPTVARPTIQAPPAQPGPPPVVPPQAPPPPPPPAPPVPPLATAAQVVAQPSAVANPAFVPGESEREAALRLAATRADGPVAPTMLWLALAGVVCLGGFTMGRFGASRSRKDSLAFCQQRSR